MIPALILFETMLVNTTPHPVAFHMGDGSILNLPACETPARCAQAEIAAGEIGGLPVVRMQFGAIANLPEPQEGTIFVASLIVCQAARRLGRTDVFAVARTVRDDAGRINGAQALTDGADEKMADDMLSIIYWAEGIRDTCNYYDGQAAAHDIIQTAKRYQ